MPCIMQSWWRLDQPSNEPETGSADVPDLQLWAAVTKCHVGHGSIHHQVITYMFSSCNS